jgi:choline kinase
LRFSTLGYEKPKPLLEVSGKPMIIQAVNSLPQSQKLIFVALKEHLQNYPLKKVLKDEFINPKIVSLENVTQGQAITCSLGLKDEDINSPLLIAATDNGMIYDQNKYQKLIEDKNVDAIIFTFRNHVSSKSNPQMYGWVKTDHKNNAISVSVKVPISKKIHKDHAIVGTFWFKKVEFFNQGLKNLIDKNIKINNEYYVDSLMGELINLGLNVKVFEVDNYLCWGTPNDYETFIYWQSFFHKAQWHPYNLHKDVTVNKAKTEMLKKKYTTFKQEHR